MERYTLKSSSLYPGDLNSVLRLRISGKRKRKCIGYIRLWVLVTHLRKLQNGKSKIAKIAKWSDGKSLANLLLSEVQATPHAPFILL